MTIAQSRVLVIGGLGFIGVNLTARLVDRGDAVTVLTPLRERHMRTALAFEQRGVRIVEGDVRRLECVQPLVADQDIVVNLSGQSGAQRSLDDPWSDLDVNCRGNLTVLESIRLAGARAKLVFVGSRLQYGQVETMPVAEDAAKVPTSLHAIHKATVEEYLHLYRRLYGLRFAAARVTNPFGPGQPGGRTDYGIVNRLIHLALTDQPLTIYGDGAQRRDYVHVSDVVDALLCLAGSEASDGRVYNIGSGTGTRMVDVAHLIVDVVGSGRVAHVPWPASARQVETGDFVADISRIRHELGWSPAIGLRDGLERTVAAWQREPGC